jgi:16S rRNA pseudouridine516 synthase
LSKRTRLDRFLSRQLGIKRQNVRPLLAQKRILVDGNIASDADLQVDEFSHVVLDAQVVQANSPRYMMLHKPVGVVSATKDDQHKTVIDLLDEGDHTDLHIVGRLDLNTSGLILLTNDSRWSKRLTEPDKKVPKVYRVTLENPLTDEYIQAFAEGMYFSYEDITTRPAQLEIISEYVAQVSLVDGRYHQIKRMFGRFRNPVTGLHRMAIGNLDLDYSLAPGQSRVLKRSEVEGIFI